MKQNLSFLDNLKPEFEKFSEFLLKWQKSVNLISYKTIPDLWNRHIVDSAQLYPLIPQNAQVLLDMGSGAGFPALVLALLNKHLNGSLKQIVLVESDVKKCVFLTEAARVFQLPVQIINQRMEDLTLEKLGIEQVDVITARALASVSVLLKLSESVRTEQTTCLFLKGGQVQSELQEVDTAQWHIDMIPSVSDNNGVIVQMRGVLK